MNGWTNTDIHAIWKKYTKVVSLRARICFSSLIVQYKSLHAESHLTGWAQSRFVWETHANTLAHEVTQPLNSSAARLPWHTAYRAQSGLVKEVESVCMSNGSETPQSHWCIVLKSSGVQKNTICKAIFVKTLCWLPLFHSARLHPTQTFTNSPESPVCNIKLDLNVPHWQKPIIMPIKTWIKVYNRTTITVIWLFCP